MPVRVLNCVISYQRYYYLKNTVESILRYLGFGDLLIIDNGSTDERLLDYLSALETRGARVMRHDNSPGLNPARGRYIESMNDALQFAATQEYDYLQIIEDDMQVMWHDPSLLDRVTRIFDQRPDALWLTGCFFDRLFPNIFDLLEPVTNLDCYRDRVYSADTTGFLRMSLVREHDLCFEAEDDNETHWKALGLHVYHLGMPIWAWLPWASAYQFGQLQGRMIPPVEEFYLKPLSEVQIDRLAKSALEEVAFDDAYCKPWGWACLRPYMSYSRELENYAQRLLQCWRRGRRIVPLWTCAGWPKHFIPSWSAYLSIGKYTLVLGGRKLLTVGRRRLAPG